MVIDSALMKGLLMIRTLLTLFVIILCLGCQKAYTSVDASYLKKYADHKAEFSRLASLFTTNKEIYKLDANSVVPDEFDKKLGNEKIQGFRQEMKDAGISGIIRIDDEIRFYVTPQHSKLIEYGYSYLLRRPSDAVKSIDEVSCKDRRTIVYREIGTGWFVYAFCSPKEY